MKTYTDIEQSKKLAEILSITTIDFAWNIFSDGSTRLLRMDDWEVIENAKSNVEIIPCWSLAALLGVIPDSIYDNTDEFSQLEFSKRSIAYHDLNDDIKIGSLKNNLIDACVDMIIKLHEQKIL